ncbi:unnamed protein product, partial (macronuclear) [Paramecium tetraurelia]
MSLSQQLKEEEGVIQPIQPVSTVHNRRKNKKRQIVNPTQNTGHWSQQEHQTYLDFLQQHKQIMESQDQKKSNKIFKQMSELIGSRSPSQCRYYEFNLQIRSHHQKFNPFIHQVKKRQKGAGRKRKDNQITQPIQHFYPFYQQPIISQHQLDFPMFQPTYPEEMVYPQPITSDRSLLYNFGFLPQFPLGFNYYNDLLVNQTIELIRRVVIFTKYCDKSIFTSLNELIPLFTLGRQYWTKILSLVFDHERITLFYQTHNSNQQRRVIEPPFSFKNSYYPYQIEIDIYYIILQYVMQLLYILISFLLMFIKAIHFSEQEVGRNVRSSKKKYVWKFFLDNVEQEIALFVSSLSGKKEVRHNGRSIHQESRYNFFHIIIFSFFGDFRYLHYLSDSYELFLDNIPFAQYYNPRNDVKGRNTQNRPLNNEDNDEYDLSPLKDPEPPKKKLKLDVHQEQTNNTQNKTASKQQELRWKQGANEEFANFGTPSTNGTDNYFGNFGFTFDTPQKETKKSSQQIQQQNNHNQNDKINPFLEFNQNSWIGQPQPQNNSNFGCAQQTSQ